MVTKAFYYEGLWLTCFILFQAIIVNSKVIAENELGSVVFVNVLYRHGDRTPVDPYPNDPYRNASFWPVGFGQLTNTGKEQEYELGQWLRKRYNSLLPDKYNKEVIYVQSTDVDRTLMSAESCLAAMFPPKGSQIWNKDISWQPIPVHTVPEKMDHVLAAKKPCPAYQEEFQRVLQTEELKKLNASYSEVYNVLNKYSGQQITSLEQIQFVYNDLFIEKLYNFTLPEWTKSVFPSPMDEVSRYSFVLGTWTKKLARLKYGPLLKEMIHNMKAQKVSKPKSPRLMNVYSAHDTTISGLLNTIGVYNMVDPPYSACFMMELRVNSTGDHFVTMFYRNSSTEDAYQLILPGCTAACPLDQYISLLESVTVEDWEAECKLSFLSYYSIWTTIVLVVLISLVVVLLVSGTIFWMRRKRATYWYRRLKTDNL